MTSATSSAEKCGARIPQKTAAKDARSGSKSADRQANHGWTMGGAAAVPTHAVTLRSLPASATAAAGRIDALDAIRAAACGIVVVGHVLGATGAAVGVPVFFALSGYLVASQAASTPSPVRLLVRRELRVLVPTVFVVALVASIWPGGPLLWPRGPLTHLWSIAVEVIGYPVIVALAPPLARRGRLAEGMVAAAAVVVAWRVWLACSVVVPAVVGDELYYGPSRVAEMLIGAALADHRARAWVPAARRALPWCIAAIAMWSVQAPAIHAAWWAATWQPVVAALTVPVVLAATAVGPMPALAPVAAVGRRTFGIYLVHLPMIVAPHGQTAAWGAMAGIAAGYVAHELLERRAAPAVTRAVLGGGAAWTGRSEA